MLCTRVCLTHSGPRLGTWTWVSRGQLCVPVMLVRDQAPCPDGRKAFKGGEQDKVGSEGQSRGMEETYREEAGCEFDILWEARAVRAEGTELCTGESQKMWNTVLGSCRRCVWNG